MWLELTAVNADAGGSHVRVLINMDHITAISVSDENVYGVNSILYPDGGHLPSINVVETLDEIKAKGEI